MILMVGASAIREAKPADLDALVRNNIAMALVSTSEYSEQQNIQSAHRIMSYHISYFYCTRNTAKLLSSKSAASPSLLLATGLRKGDASTRHSKGGCRFRVERRF